jgi:hypothetical protein
MGKPSTQPEIVVLALLCFSYFKRQGLFPVAGGLERVGGLVPNTYSEAMTIVSFSALNNYSLFYGCNFATFGDIF